MNQRPEGTDEQRGLVEVLQQSLGHIYVDISSDKALEIGESLIEFYEALGCSTPECEDSDG